MPQINYDITIGPKYDMFGLIESNSDNPILTVDNKSSTFKTKSIHDSEGLSFIGQIFKEVSSIRKTKITTNTLEVLLSDIKKEEVYYFYKILKKKITNVKILIDDKEPELEDALFIYLNKDSSIVSYLDLDDKIIWKGEQEVFPVFIWENETNQNNIIKIDNKKFSFRREREDIVISTSKPNTHAIIKDGSIFGIDMNKDDCFSISPFIMNRTLEDINKSFLEYDYSVVIPNKKTIELERKIVNSSLMVELNNFNVYKETVIIYIKKEILSYNNGDTDGLLDNYKVILDNTNEEYNDMIFSKEGKINLLILQELSLSKDIYISYKYLETNMLTGINYPEATLNNKIIKVKVGPTKITTNGISTYFNPKIFYSIEFQNGEILHSEEERVFFNKIPTKIDSHFDEEDFYKNNQSNMVSLSKTLEKTKVISLGYIDLDIIISDLDIHPYEKITKTTLGMNRKKLYNYSNIAWSINLTNTPTELIDRISVSNITGYSTICFDSKIILNNDNVSIIEFDISKLSEGITGTGEIDERYLLTDSVSELANSIASSFYNRMPNNPSTILNLKCFNLNEGFNEISTQLYISNDMESVTVKINKPNESRYTNIGLGYLDNDLLIYPTILVNL